MKNVLVFGNHKIALNCTEILRITRGINILGVVGCENTNDKIIGIPSLQEYCNKKNIPYIHSDSLDHSFLESAKKKKIDFCFSFYYRKLFNKDYINLAHEGFFNIHPSLLPKYRGPVPSMWALLNGESSMGTTIHYINEDVDSGAIIAQKKIQIDQSISGYELHGKLMDEGTMLFKEILPSILNNTGTKTRQKHSLATYYGPFKNSIRFIDWYSTKKDISNKIRTFKKPYRGALAKIKEKDIIIWSAENITYSKKNLLGPGKIMHVYEDNTFVVSTVDGFLWIKDYEFEDTDIDLKKCIYKNNIFSF